MTERTGVPAVLEQLGAGADVLPEPAEQVELFAELGLRGAPATRPVGTGTRAGRRNVRVQRVAAYLLARHGDPLETLVGMAQMGVEDLVQALGCTRLEAWQEKRHAALATLPYLHQRQPLAIALSDHKFVHLTIGEGFAGGVDSVVSEVAQFVENQTLSGGEDDAV